GRAGHRPIGRTHPPDRARTDGPAHRAQHGSGHGDLRRDRRDGVGADPRLRIAEDGPRRSARAQRLPGRGGMSLLSIVDADVYYGKAQALHGVSLEVQEGEIVSLVGRNGAGKSTLLKAAIGRNPLRRGRRLWRGADVTHAAPDRLGRLGIAFVPENRRIFATLSVEENLRIATIMGRTGAWTIDRIYRLFPRLLERARFRGDTLSGGEQQMLAIGRGLLTNPEVLLLDEPTEGLAPLIVKDLIDAIGQINAEGVAIRLVEQNLKVPLALAKRQYVLDNGRIVWQGRTEQLLAERKQVEAFISV